MFQESIAKNKLNMDNRAILINIFTFNMFIVLLIISLSGENRNCSTLNKDG